MDKLTDYRQKILTLVTEGETLISATCRPDREHLSLRRLAMARVLTSYQLFVHRDVLEPAIRDCTPAKAAQARLVKAECADLAESFRAFARHWAVEDALGAWDDYRPAALEMMRRVRQHLRNVEKLVPDISACPAPVFPTAIAERR